MIFDTHVHYDDEQFDSDREELLSALTAAGIGAAVDVGSTPESLDKLMEIARTHDHIYAAVGIHPDEVGSITDEVWDKIREYLTDSKVVAVGEIGLDYYWDKEAHEMQESWFRRQIALAKEFDKPIIVHSRSAAEDTMRVIKECYGAGARKDHGGECRDMNPAAGARNDHSRDPRDNDPAADAGRLPGIIHCYSYSAEMAREYVKMGFMIGVGGVVTYKNGRKLKETVQAIPLESIVLETDCPYLSPVPNRGKRNSSLNLPYVVSEIASLKGVTEAEVEATTWENACRVFGLG